MRLQRMLWSFPETRALVSAVLLWVFPSGLQNPIVPSWDPSHEDAGKGITDLKKGRTRTAATIN